MEKPNLSTICGHSNVQKNGTSSEEEQMTSNPHATPHATPHVTTPVAPYATTQNYTKFKSQKNGTSSEEEESVSKIMNFKSPEKLDIK